MIQLRSKRELKLIRQACAVVKSALAQAEGMVQPGVATEEIDRALEIFIRDKGGRPAFKGYRGYPKATCLSLNEMVVHGIPGRRKLKEGDILGVDVGVELEGYYGDGARTYPVGRIATEDERLVRATQEAFFRGIEALRNEGTVGDLSFAVESHAGSCGFSTVRALSGHGIGKALHEDPEVPNFGFRGRGTKVEPGMVMAVEPMVNAGGYEVEVLEDGWTVVTLDRRHSAHYENTIAVTSDGIEILTL